MFKAVLRGGRVVAPDPPIVTRDLCVSVRSHYHPSQVEKSRVGTRRLPRPRPVAAAAIALVTPCYYNHYHWLVDHLSRAPLLHDEPELPVIVPPRPSRVQLDSLELVWIDRARLRPLQHPHMQIEELHWPSLLGETGHPPRSATQRLRGRLVPGGSAGDEGRLYVAPRATDERRVVNDRQQRAFRRERGFDVIDPAEMSFGEQRAAFATAGVIVGPHGRASRTWSRPTTPLSSSWSARLRQRVLLYAGGVARSQVLVHAWKAQPRPRLPRGPHVT